MALVYTNYHTIFFYLFYFILFGPLWAAAFMPILSARFTAYFGLYFSTLIFWLSFFLIGFYAVITSQVIEADYSNEIFDIVRFIKKPYVLDIEFSVDSISMLFLFLTSFIFYICTFLAFETFYEDLKSLKLFFFLLFVMQSFVSAAFFAVSPIFFYFFFWSRFSADVSYYSFMGRSS